MRQRIRVRIADIAVYLLLSALAIAWVLPIVFLLYTSLRERPSTGIVNQLVPDNLKLGFGNFNRLFTKTDFPIWLKNTLVVSVSSCALTTLFILMVSYALSRLRFRFRKPLMRLLLVLGDWRERSCLRLCWIFSTFPMCLS